MLHDNLPRPFVQPAISNQPRTIRNWSNWHPTWFDFAELELAEVGLASSYPLIHCLVVLHWLAQSTAENSGLWRQLTKPLVQFVVPWLPIRLARLDHYHLAHYSEPLLSRPEHRQ